MNAREGPWGWTPSTWKSRRRERARNSSDTRADPRDAAGGPRPARPLARRRFLGRPGRLLGGAVRASAVELPEEVLWRLPDDPAIDGIGVERQRPRGGGDLVSAGQGRHHAGRGVAPDQCVRPPASVATRSARRIRAAVG